MFWRVWGAYLCALAGAAAGRVGWSGGEDERRSGHGAGLEDRLCVGGDLGSLADGSGGAGEVDGVDPVEFAGDGGPGGAGVVLGDADEDQCEEAQRDVGLDAVLLAVVDGADLQDGLEVPESAFDVEEAFEESGGVCGWEVVVGAGQQVLAVEFRLGGDGLAVDGEGAAAADEVALEDWVGEEFALGGEAGVAGLLGDRGEFGLEPGEVLVAGGGVPGGFGGVADDDEPPAGGAGPDPGPSEG